MQVIYTERHRLHDTSQVRIHGETINEVPERAEIILQALQQTGWANISAPTDFGLAPLHAVHTPGLLNFLQTIYIASQSLPQRWPAFFGDAFATRNTRRSSPHPWAQMGYYAFDIEAPFLAGTWEAVYWSAQTALSGAQAVLDGEQTAYALCRPPGHHALADQTGGFCYLNNAAIAARWLQHGRPTPPRIALLDIDYHHGNGTQEIFYTDSSVFYVSIHGHPDEEYPFYWGGEEERGAGEGEGFNLNLPLPAGTDDAGYLAAVDNATAAIQAYAPDYLVLSLGFDAAEGDPSALAGFRVSTPGFAEIGRRLAALHRPTLLVQEGGYRLETLGQNAVAFLEAFAV